MRRRLVICAALAAVVLLVYWPVLDHDFLIYDDDVYVTQNSQVREGLNADTLRWAFTTFHASNWHPLTWVSHMLDVELYGLDPAGHHLTGLMWHVLNTLLLFLVLERLSGATWPAALAAVLFGLHPLHVESVAWIAERKDVLSTFFWLLVMGAWGFYAARPGLARYLAVALLLALGLMAKPMLVTLPLVLLLLDVWPLKRLPSSSPARLIAEKLPLLLLCAGSAAVTLVAQRAGGAMGSVEGYPLPGRAANAIAAAATYLRKAVWPSDLAVFYPYPRQGTGLWPVTFSAVLLVALTGLAWWHRRGRPWLLFGWAWFLITLTPVLGLIQVGEQALADRYSYVPLIGPFIAVAWWAAARRRKTLLAAAGAICLLALALVTRVQLSHWKDSVTLFEHATEVTGASHLNLAMALVQRGEYARAVEHAKTAVERRPDLPETHNTLGLAQAGLGRNDEALASFERAIRLDPTYAEGLNNVAGQLARQGRIDEALALFEQSVRSNPDYARGHYNWGTTLAGVGRPAEAIPHLLLAVALDPRLAEAHFNLGAALWLTGKRERGRAAILRAQELGYPVGPEVWDRLERAASVGGD